MSKERWTKAQQAENRYWQSTRKSWSTEDRRKYWQEKLAHGFNLNYDFFTDKSVLEIGCGPSGIIFQLNNAKSRIGIEPMDIGRFIEEEELKKSIVRKGIGERLPFDHNSFDIVLSFNALDHCFDPSRVIQEIYRVLPKEGDFLLWIYTLKDQYSFLQSILNKLDPPHPYHFTLKDVLAMLKDNLFKIKHERYDKGTGLPNNTVRKVIGNCMMNSVWLWLKKQS
jgi:ubiquinone/menaquinone biosynthesis C-methylase UbiE